MGRAPRARRSGDDPFAREHGAHRAARWSESPGAAGGRAAADTNLAVPLAGREDAGLRGDLGWRSTAVRAPAEHQLSATPLAGTSGAQSPFFSPDGKWVGFWAAGTLQKVLLAGDPAVQLCDAAAIFGASWGSDGTIVFASARNAGLWRVSAAGGTPQSLTTPQEGEFSHRLPHVLPGGRAVIFTILKGAQRWNDTQVVVRSLTTGEQSVLIEGGADGRYVPTGHLVYIRLGTLMAAPFDLDRLAVTGGAIGLVDNVMQAANRNISDMENTLAGQVTFSDTGALVYVTGGALPGAHACSRGWIGRDTARRSRRRRDRIQSPACRPTGATSRSPPNKTSVTCGGTILRAAHSIRSRLTGTAATACLRQTGSGSSSARARPGVKTTCIGRPPMEAGGPNA